MSNKQNLNRHALWVLIGILMMSCSFPVLPPPQRSEPIESKKPDSSNDTLVNLNDFGGYADDYRDDSRALYQALISLQPHQTLYLPAGLYLINRPVEQPILNPIKIKGEVGTILKGNGRGKMVNLWSSMDIQQLEIQGFETALYYKGAEQNIEVNIEKLTIKDCINGIHFLGHNKGTAQSFKIANCTIIGNDSSQLGISTAIFNNPSNLQYEIINNKVENFNIRGIHIGSNNIKQQPLFHNIKVINNEVSNIGLNSTIDGINGIIVYGSNVVISNNKIKNISIKGDDSEGLYTKIINGEITNNYLENAGGNEGMMNIKGNNLDSDKFPKGGNILIESNTIISTHDDAKISLLNIQAGNVLAKNNILTGGSYGISCRKYEQSGDNVLIENNVLKKQNSFAIYFKVENSKSFTFANNQADSCGGFFYLRSRNATNFKINNNTISNMQAQYPIQFQDTQETGYIEIMNNIVNNGRGFMYIKEATSNIKTLKIQGNTVNQKPNNSVLQRYNPTIQEIINQ